METLFLALRVIVALGAILALIWVVQRRLTKSGGKKSLAGFGAARFGAAKAITVVGTHRLSAKASITVVEINGETLVLGVTDQGITVLENSPQPPTVVPATAAIAHPEAIDPESDTTRVAASAVDPLATADAPEPVDFAAIFREALDEVAETPVLATVVETPENAETPETAVPSGEEHVAPRRRRRRVTIPALAEQLLPHMTRTLAGAIGLRVAPAPPARPAAAEARPASSHPAPVPVPVPVPVSGAVAAFLRNAEPEPLPAKRRDYSTAVPLAAHLPVLHRAS